MNLNNIYTIAIIIFFTPLMGKLMKSSYDFYKLNKEYNEGNKLLDLLYRLTHKEFEIWVSEYLSTLGYTNIIISPLGKTKDNNLLCTKNNKSFYVECTRKIFSTSISEKDMELLLGSLISDGIHNGIYITTNKVSEAAINYVKNLKDPYSIEVISLCNEFLYYKDYLLKIN